MKLDPAPPIGEKTRVSTTDGTRGLQEGHAECGAYAIDDTGFPPVHRHHHNTALTRQPSSPRRYTHTRAAHPLNLVRAQAQAGMRGNPKHTPSKTGSKEGKGTLGEVEHSSFYRGVCVAKRGVAVTEWGPGRHNGPHPLSPRRLGWRISGPRVGGAGGSRDGIGLASFLGGLAGQSLASWAFLDAFFLLSFQGFPLLRWDRLRGGMLRLRRRYRRWICKPGRDQHRLLSV